MKNALRTAEPLNRLGFSLVELSIVLVILGLLVGGVLTGKSLIRASEMRGAIAEYQRYYQALQTFRGKYFALPGDITNATILWGRMNSNADCVTNSSAAVSADGACDGNGNSQLNGNAASQSSEIFQFWRQLSLAGLIEGEYTGISGSLSAYDADTGSNVPKSKFSGGSWSTMQRGSLSGNTQYYTFSYGHIFTLGKENGSDYNNGALLVPDDAWNIDTKLDDGFPGSGKIIAKFWNNACATATSATDYTSPYNLASTSAQCALLFNNQF